MHQSFWCVDAAEICGDVGLLVLDGAFESGSAVAEVQGVRGK
jgi:hypothetical protein